MLPSLHAHPRQQQRLEVLSGSLGAQVGRRRSVVGPGTRIVVPAGARHRFWNAGVETVQLVAETTPALRHESLVETLFALGEPGALQRAAAAAAHFDSIRLTRAPAPLERLGLALAAAFGRAAGRAVPPAPPARH